MSGSGTAEKHLARCWVCSLQLRANFHRIALTPDGHEVVVHADCAERERLTVVPKKHLAKTEKS